MLFRRDRTTEDGSEIASPRSVAKSRNNGIVVRDILRKRPFLFLLLVLAAVAFYEAQAINVSVAIVSLLLMEIGASEGFGAAARRFEEIASRVAILGLLSLIVPLKSREYLIGDLEEEYWTDIFPVRSWFGARCWWWWQVLGIVAPYIWKRVRSVLGLEVVRRWRRR